MSEIQTSENDSGAGEGVGIGGVGAVEGEGETYGDAVGVEVSKAGAQPHNIAIANRHNKKRLYKVVKLLPWMILI